MNILTDIAVAVLPLPFLRQLQLNKRSKIALMLVFALGGACVSEWFNTSYSHTC
jgi:hypothetical protein